jgi:hypothetical protein
VIPGHRSEIRVPTGVQGNEGDKLDFRVYIYLFIYSENTEILPIERTTIRMVNYNQQQYTFEASN